MSNYRIQLNLRQRNFIVNAMEGFFSSLVTRLKQATPQGNTVTLTVLANEAEAMARAVDAAFPQSRELRPLSEADPELEFLAAALRELEPDVLNGIAP